MSKYTFIPALLATLSLLMAGCREKESGNEITVITAEGKTAYTSLKEAVDAAVAAPGTDPVRVELGPGIHRVDAPLSIGACPHPISFVPMKGAHPVISGDVPLTGWEADGKRWRCKVPEGPDGKPLDIDFLFVDGERAIRARTPDEGGYGIPAFYDRSVEGAAEASYEFQVDSAGRKALAGIAPGERPYMMVYRKWEVSYRPLESWDEKGFTIGGAPIAPWIMVNDGSSYYLENYMAALDAPGEWILHTDGYLYYIPKEGQTLAKTAFTVPVTHKLLRIEGTPQQKAHDISFTGIAFEHTGFGPEGWRESLQAAVSTEAAVEASYAERIVFDRCTFAHLSEYALWLGAGCHSCRVTTSLFRDLGAGGIRMGVTKWEKGDDVPDQNIISNNILREGGRVFPSGVAILMMHAADNLILHNEIFDFGYTGISVGWVWGFSDSPSKRNEIAYNHIHHLGWGLLSDMGAIYTLGKSEGTVIHHNLIHDIFASQYGGWGLYTDEGSSDILLENNVVYATKHGGFHQHYGLNNTVRNNIFAWGIEQQLQFSRADEEWAFDFTGNIVLMDAGILIGGRAAESPMYKISKNLYFDMRGKAPEFPGLEWKEWKVWREEGAKYGNPLFKDPYNADFSFTSMRNAQRIGFKPIDISTAGVTGSRAWKKLAQMPEKDIQRFNDIVRAAEPAPGGYYDLKARH